MNVVALLTTPELDDITERALAAAGLFIRKRRRYDGGFERVGRCYPLACAATVFREQEREQWELGRVGLDTPKTPDDDPPPSAA